MVLNHSLKKTEPTELFQFGFKIVSYGLIFFRFSLVLEFGLVFLFFFFFSPSHNNSNRV
jgi:hypothetical protein